MRRYFAAHRASKTFANAYAQNKRAFKKWLREMLGVQRLPAHIEIWCVTTHGLPGGKSG